jgi:lipid-binding SYLF domain-containing protein
MKRFIALPVLLLLLTAAACETAPPTQAGKDALHEEVNATIARFKAEDPSLKAHFDQALGYAVFPSVGKGAAGIGGAYGKGELYENGRRTGYCDLTQGTLGAALGGQEYSQIIFFKTQEALNNFKYGDLAFAANASAVAVRAGAAATAKYESGVLVQVMPRRGLMAEAAIGGQKFSYRPLGSP